MQNSLNKQRREENKSIITDQRTSVLRNNKDRGIFGIAERRNMEKSIKDKRTQDYNTQKKMHDTSFIHKRNVSNQQKYSRDQFFDSVMRVNMMEASEHEKNLKKHEGHLRKLDEMETRMVANLSATLAKKNKAVELLNQRSPGLMRTMQPRNAFVTRSHNVDDMDQMAQTQIGFPSTTSPPVTSPKKEMVTELDVKPETVKQVRDSLNPEVLDAKSSKPASHESR